jgi:hypothetical protein
MKNCKNLISQDEKPLKSYTQQVEGKTYSKDRFNNQSVNSLDRL